MPHRSVPFVFFAPAVVVLIFAVFGFRGQAVIENSKTRGSLKDAEGLSAGNGHEIQKVQTASGLVMASNPVAIVVSPRLVQVVERTTGEVLNKVFIKNIPFTLEAPGRADG